MLALLRSTITQPRNMVIVMAHWCLHAYGIISLTQLTDPLLHSLVLLLVPLPALFYILTARYCMYTLYRFVTIFLIDLQIQTSSTYSSKQPLKEHKSGMTQAIL